jgi:hypothetical protein
MEFLSYNSGISHNDEVDTVAIAPFVKVSFELPGYTSSRLSI